MQILSDDFPEFLNMQAVLKWMWHCEDRLLQDKVDICFRLLAKDKLFPTSYQLQITDQKERESERLH